MSTTYREALAELLAQVDARCGGKAEGNSSLAAAADRARELLTATRREFFVPVLGKDMNETHAQRYDADPRGPLALETYLDDWNTYANVSAVAQRFTDHKWVRIGRLIVEDWPVDDKPTQEKTQQ